MTSLRSIVPCCGFGNGLDPYFSWGRRVDTVAEECEPCMHAKRDVILKLHSQWISAMVACEQDIQQQTAVPELAEVTGRVAGEQNRLEGGVHDVYGVRRKHKEDVKRTNGKIGID